MTTKSSSPKPDTAGLAEALPGLNPKQLSFVVNYVGQGCMDQAKAARAAGYSPKTAGVRAMELLKREDIQAEVERRQQMLMLRVDVSQAWVLERLKHEALTGDNTGSRVRALELLGKHIGMWSERNVGSIQVYQLLVGQLEEVRNAGYDPAAWEAATLDLVPDDVDPDAYSLADDGEE